VVHSALAIIVPTVGICRRVHSGAVCSRKVRLQLSEGDVLQVVASGLAFAGCGAASAEVQGTLAGRFFCICRRGFLVVGCQAGAVEVWVTWAFPLVGYLCQWLGLAIIVPAINILL